MLTEFESYNIIEILPVENVSQIQRKAPTYYSKDIREITAVMANTTLFIGADSGMMHLSTSSGTTTIGLFHITDLVRYEPYGNKNCGLNTDDISTEDIIKEIRITSYNVCYTKLLRCALHWHKPLFDLLPNVELILLIGQYAQNYYLENPKKTLTENVKNYQDFLPRYFVLPHPSPRNRFWLKKNFWFEEEVIPVLQEKVHAILKK